jgi:peptide/nickel transport system permease protein
MLDIKRIPIPALIGMILTAAVRAGGDLRAVDRAARQWRNRRRCLGADVGCPFGSAPTISAATCLSRMIYGARITMFIAVLATALSFSLGAILGFSAAVSAAGSIRSCRALSIS